MRAMARRVYLISASKVLVYCQTYTKLAEINYWSKTLLRGNTVESSSRMYVTCNTQHYVCLKVVQYQTLIDFQNRINQVFVHYN